jgi:uncharacterized protein YndB with AHSA1/START domain
LWAAAAALQIITIGLTVATALTVRATRRDLDPETTWSVFAAVTCCPFCRGGGGRAKLSGRGREPLTASRFDRVAIGSNRARSLPVLTLGGVTMHIEAQTTISRPRSEVFDHLAHAERLPEYVTDFAWVKQVSSGEPGRGTEYSYKMKRGQAESTFEWTEFDAPSKLAWHGPPVKAGLGSIEPAGSWDLSDEGDGTRVTLVMAPEPGGLFKLMAPLMSSSMRKGNARALELLKQQVEGGTTPPS